MKNIKEEYDEIYEYVNGVAIVELDGKEFHIDKNGNPLYEERYDWVSEYDDIILVNIDHKWFHMDNEGNPLYEERYDLISRFDDTDTALVQLGDKEFYIDLNGKKVEGE